jgi:predicted phage terminase large subunit-like protein
MDFIPTVSPGFVQPRHLSPFVGAIERAVDDATSLLSVIERRARGEDVPEPPALRLCVSVPPRHSKTETAIHGIAWALRRSPRLTVGYGSYSAALAHEKSKRALALARRGEVQMGTLQRADRWQTADEGGMMAAGVNGPFTGFGFHILIIDDPYKNRAEVESGAVRSRVWDWYHDVAMTRVEPGGAVIVIHTRWRDDDLIGRLVKEEGYEYLNLPAIDDDGKALWPEKYPADSATYRDAQKSPITWSSLYQGRPRPKGGSLFMGATTYVGPPPSGMRIGIGLDFAYSEKTSSDWSVACVVGAVGSGEDTRIYVLDVIRVQEQSASFEQRIRALAVRYPSAKILFKGSSIECVVAENMRSRGLKRLKYETARGDKFVRAEPASKLWNGGQVLVPGVPDDDDNDPPEWVGEFVAEVTAFTGVKDEHDDQVDALGTAIDAAMSGVSLGVDETLLSIGVKTEIQTEGRVLTILDPMDL